jgi:hypothetical protein
VVTSSSWYQGVILVPTKSEVGIIPALLKLPEPFESLLNLALFLEVVEAEFLSFLLVLADIRFELMLAYQVLLLRRLLLAAIRDELGIIIWKIFSDGA